MATRRINLYINGKVVESYKDVPDALSKQITVFEPLLRSNAEELPLLLAKDEEIEAVKKMMQWLRRDVSLNELVTGMVEFRALATCADKFAIVSLLEELSVRSLYNLLRALCFQLSIELLDLVSFLL